MVTVEVPPLVEGCETELELLEPELLELLLEERCHRVTEPVSVL